MDDLKVLVVGAGPAGLTAAYELSKRKIAVTVLEKDDAVGGIAKTIDHRGYKFDLGGHRFFTKIQHVKDIWNDVLREDFLLRPRLSRIYYKKKFYNYPLRISNVAANLGPAELMQMTLSYLKAKARPKKNAESFEDYITNSFGRRLYEIFFKSYTEKVWGIPCTALRAEWAAQRVKGMSFSSIVRTALLGNKGGIKSLIEEFHYPKHGPGQLWNNLKEMVEAAGGEVLLNSEAVGINTKGRKVVSVSATKNGSTRTYDCDYLISSMPLKDLVERLNPKPPADVLYAAGKVRYRDFITVALIVDKEDLWPDNWIYINDKEYLAGRVQNYKNWSPHMAPDRSKSCIGVEYFAFENDDLWLMKDEDLIRLAAKELVGLSLLESESLVEDGKVVRVKKAYPLYDQAYKENLEKVKNHISQFQNLHTIGRNGMHRYNNQDHSMLTAILAVENILGASHDIWSVNTEQEYHETDDNKNKAKD